MICRSCIASSDADWTFAGALFISSAKIKSEKIGPFFIEKDSFLGAIIVSLPMISLITISWIYFETKDVDRIIDFSYGVFAMIMPSLSFFITLPYFLKKINFIPSMFLSISIMVVLYFALSMLYKKIGVDI